MTVYTRAYFNRLRPYFLENWYSKVAPYTIPTRLLPLSLEQARLLGSPTATTDPAAFPALVSRLAQAMDELSPQGVAFVRLGSRSPKDVPAFRQWRGRTRLAYEALHWLRHSRRIAEDLRLCLKYQYAPVLVVRQWRPIPLWAEFRCFIHNRRLRGISQTHLALGPLPEVAGDAAAIEASLRGFCHGFIQDTGFRRGAMDVYITPNPEPERPYTVTLIEFNPLMPPTDPLLFRWRGEDLDGSFRYLRPAARSPL